MAANTEPNSDFDAKTKTFIKWLQQRPGASVNPKIEVADLRACSAGRGVVALADIDDNEELFTISLTDVLSVESSDLSRLCPEVVQRLDSWNALILAMIYEDGQGQQSHWWPYLDVLPTDFDTLIHWSQSELAELQGSAVLEKIGKEEAEDSFRKTLLPIVQANAALFGNHKAALEGSEAAKVLTHLAHRMATLIMACGFDLENEASSEEHEEADGSSQSAYELNKGMVPLADLFNANADLNNAHLVQNETSMTMISLKSIKKGEELFNDYGQLPRSDLLRRYGYITDRYKQWDVVELSIDALKDCCNAHRVLSEEKKSQRLQLAAHWEVLQDGYDLYRPRRNRRFEFEDELLLTITALIMTEEDYDRAILIEESPEKPPSSLQLSLCLVLRSIIAKRNEAYRTTIAEDITLLQTGTITGRRRMAVEVRLGEKEILALATDRVDKWITQLMQTQETLQAQETKKRKI